MNERIFARRNPIIKKVIFASELFCRIRNMRQGKTLVTSIVNKCTLRDAILLDGVDGQTYGDVIKAVFPQIEVTDETRATIHFYVDTKEGTTIFTGCMPAYIWDAPYKRRKTNE